MKITTGHGVNFFEVNENLELRPRGLVNLLQQAAMLHSRRAGYEAPVLMKTGRAWILHRIAINISELPVFGDEVEVVTWHKGSRGFKSYRDFEIIRNGEKLVSATSLWLFIDLERKKILKPPHDLIESYTVEPGDATDADLDRWKPENGFEPESSVTITTRPSDYDPLGHVNNALYFDYLETLTESAFKAPYGMRQIKVQFNREISKDVASVQAGLKTSGKGYIFEITSASGNNAAGEFY
ncbi:MAG: acyl-[acyl-carrier-protein] thioesterase [Desulfobacterales bacterium]